MPEKPLSELSALEIVEKLEMPHAILHSQQIELSSDIEESLATIESITMELRRRDAERARLADENERLRSAMERAANLCSDEPEAILREALDGNHA